jgi:hypothetical protein
LTVAAGQRPRDVKRSFGYLAINSRNAVASISRSDIRFQAIRSRKVILGGSRCCREAVRNLQDVERVVEKVVELVVILVFSRNHNLSSWRVVIGPESLSSTASSFHLPHIAATPVR